MSQHATGGLIRSLSLWQVVLYGLGVTIGAGIYVLVGVAAGKSGAFAPAAFLVAAVLLSFTAASFAELATRLPVSASEAAYVDAGFHNKGLTLTTGLLVIATASISAATVSVGAAGYVAVFLPLAPPLLITLVVVSMGLIACLTTAQSVTLAGLMTAVEVGGLLAIIGAGLMRFDLMAAGLPDLSRGMSAVPWSGLFATSLVAVFAFIGFEHVVNIAEEVRDPRRILPKALFITLFITAILYAAVVFVAVAAVPVIELAASGSPLAVAYERLTGHPLGVMSAVAVVATLNGLIVHMIMISRVAYGMARAGSLPRSLGTTHPRTHTPLRATVLAIGAVLVLALAFPIEALAQFTAQGTLFVFLLVNAALVWIRRNETITPAAIYRAPAWAPYLGFLAAAMLLAASFAGP